MVEDTLKHYSATVTKPLTGGVTFLLVGVLLLVAALREFYVGAVFLVVGASLVWVAISRSKKPGATVTICKGCGRYVAENVPACPNCGRPGESGPR